MEDRALSPTANALEVVEEAFGLTWLRFEDWLAFGDGRTLPRPWSGVKVLDLDLRRRRSGFSRFNALINVFNFVICPSQLLSSTSSDGFACTFFSRCQITTKGWNWFEILAKDKII